MGSRRVPTRGEWEEYWGKRGGEEMVSGTIEEGDWEGSGRTRFTGGVVTQRPDNRFTAHATEGVIRIERGTGDLDYDEDYSVEGRERGYRTEYRAQVAADNLRSRF